MTAKSSPLFWWLVAALLVLAIYSARKPIGEGIDMLTGAAKNRALLIAAATAAGITSAKELAMFLAQMDHESGGFRRLEESFRYSSAARLMAVSASARKAGEAAVTAALSVGPFAVAAIMYGGRMGNDTKGDGYRYRGRGFVQLTGKDNYQAAGRAIGVDLIANPEAAAQPETAAKLAVWYWQSRVGATGKTGDTVAITKLINGGTNGLEDRKALYSKYLADAQSGVLA